MKKTGIGEITIDLKNENSFVTPILYVRLKTWEVDGILHSFQGPGLCLEGASEFGYNYREIAEQICAGIAFPDCAESPPVLLASCLE